MRETVDTGRLENPFAPERFKRVELVGTRLRGRHYGQRLIRAAPTGRTHGRTDQDRSTSRNPLPRGEPSTHGATVCSGCSVGTHPVLIQSGPTPPVPRSCITGTLNRRKIPTDGPPAFRWDARCGAGGGSASGVANPGRNHVRPDIDGQYHLCLDAHVLHEGADVDGAR